MLSIPKVVSPSQFFVVFFILINTQFLAVYGLNPIGIYGFQELFFVLESFVAVIYFLKFRFSIEELTVFLIPIAALFLSSLFSLYWFDQPFLYGVMEYRRVLGVYIFFVLVWAIRTGVLTTDSILEWIMAIAVLLGFLNIIFSGASVGSGVSQESIERTGIGQHFVAMGAVMFFGRWVNSGKIIDIFLFLFLFLVLLLVIQSRQIAIATLAVLPIILKISLKDIPVLFLFFMFLFGIGYYEPFQDAILERLPRMEELVENGIYEITESARGVAIYEILNEFQSTGWFWGHGGLYQYWNGGFESYYGPNFILADVGLIGGLYRLGFIYVLFLFFYLRLQIKSNLRIVDQVDKKLIWALFIQLLIMSPTGSLFSYRGHVLGVILAIALSMGGYYRRHCPEQDSRKFYRLG
jgi:hypothetical protein